MKVITRLVNGAYLQATQYPGLQFKLVPNTTLNERFGILADQVPPGTDIPSLRYFTIGNGGHKFDVGANGIGKPSPIQHKPTDCALFNHIPFALREPANDFTVAQMSRYRLRVPVVINGVNYIAYYARVIDYTGIAPQMEYVTTQADGSQVVTPYVPTSKNLNPSPSDLSPTGVNVVTGDYVQVSVKAPLSFTEDDAAELVNVANIMYGDPDLAIVSEIALCSGIDKLVQGGGNGQPTFNYTESIAMQCCSIFNAFYSMQYADEGIDVMLDIGSVEPMLGVTNVSAALTA